MKRHPVPSSNLASAGYDPPSEILEVEFQNGSIYQYYNVPQSIYDGLVKAPSAGRFFAYEVRNSFPYSRVG